MNAVMQMVPASANSAAISPMRRMFSCRSSGEKPRSALRPRRTLSPSSVYARQPWSNKLRSSAIAIVDLPDPGSPVSQTTAPTCPARDARSAAVN